MPAGGLVTLGAIGAVQAGIGLIKGAKAKKEAKRLAESRPKYQESATAGQAVNLAESELAKGMSSRAEKAYLDANDRQLSASLSAILKGGGSVNNIGDVFGKSEVGKANLATMQDNLRLNQINNVVRAQQYKDEQDDKKFMYDIDALWKDSTQANAAARKDAANLTMAGINTFGSAVGGGMFGAKTKKDNDAYLDNKYGDSSASQYLATPSSSIYNNTAVVDRTLPENSYTYNSLMGGQ